MLTKVTKLGRNRHLSTFLFSTSVRTKLAAAAPALPEPQTLQFVINTKHLKQLGARKFDDQLYP